MAGNLYSDLLNGISTIRSSGSMWDTLAIDTSYGKDFTTIYYEHTIDELSDKLAQDAATDKEMFDKVIKSLKKSFEKYGVLPEIDQEEFMKLLF